MSIDLNRRSKKICGSTNYLILNWPQQTPCCLHAHVYQVMKNNHFAIWRQIFETEDKTQRQKLLRHALRGYRSSVDFPSSLFYRDLMEMYPNAKVLLTTRSAESWSIGPMMIFLCFRFCVLFACLTACTHPDSHLQTTFTLSLSLSLSLSHTHTLAHTHTPWHLPGTAAPGTQSYFTEDLTHGRPQNCSAHG